MDIKVSLVVLTAVANLLLVEGITNVRGKKMLLLNKPFFSSNVHKSEAFKNIKVIEATEKVTTVADSTGESKPTTNVMKTFTCTSQKGDNRTKGKPTPIILHQTPITTSPKASTSYSLHNIAAVTTSAYSANSPDETERTTAPVAECKSGYNKKFNNSCYKFVKAKATRSQAQTACKVDSSHLVFIETKEENDFLISKATSGIEYWIGIHERPNLFWDNGNEVIFANIDPEDKKTFNDRTGCYRMSNNDGRYWLDMDCTKTNRYICECEGVGCQSGYNKRLHNSSYKFVSNEATMFAARSACKGDSSHLVFIETKNESDFLVGKTKRGKQYWIGMHGKPKFFWDDNNQVTFVNIDPDNKNTFNEGTGCYRMTANGERYWRDRDCSVQYSYICEY